MRRVLRLSRAGAVVLALALAAGAGAAPARSADIGGPFALIDHTGQAVTEADYAGRHLLVYFGYATCPDVCPTELLVVGQAMDLLGPLADRVQPLFVTVDPARDTAAALADYVPSFHPRLVGLTGDEAQVRAAARAYRVYYRLHEPDEDGAYLVDHTSYTYLMGPDGAYLAHFVYGQGPEKMAEIIRRHLE